MAESSKNRCGIDRLEALISNVDVKKYHEDALSRFESFKVIMFDMLVVARLDIPVSFSLISYQTH